MAFSLENDLDSYGFTVYWRIENFNLNPGNNFSINSPEFKIKTLKSKWLINIQEKDKYLAVYLFKEKNPMGWGTHISLSLLKGKDWVPIFENETYRFKPGGRGFGAHQVVSLGSLKEDKWNYLPNGSLTISFRIWVNKLKYESTQCLMISRLENKINLCHRPIEYFSNFKSSDFLSFPCSYDFHSNKQSLDTVYHTAKKVKTRFTQTDTDQDQLIRMLKDFGFVTLRTPKRDFTVNKDILCAKSPVFNAMFKRRMKENDCNLVDIDDVDSQTMASLVKFLYFQPLGDLKWEDAVTLYYAADKYQIDLLRKECVKYLKKELSVENVCDALLLADLHQDADLMSFIEEYFCKNSKLILILKQWKDFLRHTDLVAKILYKLAQRI